MSTKGHFNPPGQTARALFEPERHAGDSDAEADANGTPKIDTTARCDERHPGRRASSAAD